MTDGEFQFVKIAAVAAGLLSVGLAQLLFPYKWRLRELVGNWKVNLPLAVINAALVSVACVGCACTVARWAEAHGVGLMNTIAVPHWVAVFASVFLLDLLAYGWHRANHTLNGLWRFHAVHHSDRVFDVSTALRFHPGEIAISLVIRLLAVLLLGLPAEGILAFEVIYAFANFFEHGDLRLRSSIERGLAKVIVTPALHRAHHSILSIELNSNFGTIFSVWDRAFGSFRPAASSDVVEVGLPEWQTERLRELLASPFRERSGGSAGFAPRGRKSSD